MSNPTSPTQKCHICSKLRPLPKHLFELSQYCLYLGNSVIYKKGDGSRDVNTSAIGSWLELASNLEKVEINTWAFSGSNALYCGSAADYYDRNSEHYSKFTTDLTRFIFICNALEETYRFVSHHYDEASSVKNLKPSKRLREPSLKAAYLINFCDKKYFPKQFVHICGNFKKAFTFYEKEFSPQLSSMDNIKDTDENFSLHLVRNLRNHIAHGIFPLLEHPENVGGSHSVSGLLSYLLKSASRVSALYIQVFMIQYCKDFESYEYDQIKGACGEMFERFLENCTPKYAHSLHFNQNFQFESWIEYTTEFED